MKVPPNLRIFIFRKNVFPFYNAKKNHICAVVLHKCGQEFFCKTISVKCSKKVMNKSKQ